MFDGKKDVVRLYASYSKIVDKDWYLNEYDDVKLSEENPVVHFISHGESEGRNPNGCTNTAYIKSQIPPSLGIQRPIEYQISVPVSECPRPLPCIDLAYVCAEYELADSLDAIQYLNSCEKPIKTTLWFDQSSIAMFNQKTSKNPYHGFLNSLGSKFQFSAEFAVIERSMFVSRYQNDFDAVDTFEWNLNQWVVCKTKIGPRVINQITEQFKVEPIVAYSNPRYIPFLRNYAANDLSRRDLIDTSKLLDNIQKRAHTVLVISKLQIGGAEKYILNLAAEIAKISGETVELLVTDQNQFDIDQFVSANQIRQRNVVIKSLYDWYQKTWKKDFILAQYLMMKNCKNIIVCNSSEGYKTISNYGKQLSSKADLFSVFFSEAPVEFGVSHSARHVLDAINWGTVISDNKNYIENTKLRVPKFVQDKFTFVPSLLEGSGTSIIENSIVRSRINRSRKRKILWFGRVEVLKDIESLIEFGKNNNSVSIDVFGPIDLYEQIDFPPNVVLKGAVRHLGDIELINYDVFLFTSKFEGMPNSVLEIANVGMPIIAADVGGIRSTFGSDTLFMYTNSRSSKSTAFNINKAFEEYLSHDQSEIIRRVHQAKQLMLDQHGKDVFSGYVQAAFFIKENGSK